MGFIDWGIDMPTSSRRRASMYLVGTVALGWIVTGTSILIAPGPAAKPVTALLVSAVPAAAAVVLIRARRDDAAARILRRGLTSIRIGRRWYLVALVLLPAVHIAGLGLATLVGGRLSPNPSMFALLPLFLITSLGEEIGWRGYALPKLQEDLSPLMAGLLVGIAWAAFHWLALLGNGKAAPAYIAVNTLLLVAFSIILTLMFNSTGQVLAVVVIAHAMYNTVSVGVAPLVDSGAPLTAFALSAAVAWLIVGGLVLRPGSRLDGARPVLLSASANPA